MPQRIYQVDSFTDKPFAGNPAGVCVLKGPADESWMRDVAREMNLSETAFLYPVGDQYSLRWFTPLVEVELCGHATLAAAHILWTEDYLPESHQARFTTKSGILTGDRRGEMIELDFPARTTEEVLSPEGLLNALGIESATFVGITRSNYLVEVESEQTVRNLSPDFSELLRIKIRAVIVTSRSANDDYDFVSRYFAPGVGVNEDPVTGSAHCSLGPYWKNKLGKETLKAYQASSRGGTVHVRFLRDRITLGGQAVTVLRCEML